MTPAALAALLNGDEENFMTAVTPGGIQAQKRAGQIAFVANETLPIKCNGMRKQIESLGIEYGEPVDDLFVSVKLPDGWQKVAADHSMYSDLVDAKGRKRASIFYKAAFYDRRADMSLVRRYTYGYEPVGGYTEDGSSQSSSVYGYVKDLATDEVIWCTAQALERPDDSAPREEHLAFYDAKDALVASAKDWLNDQFPDWEDPLAYWD